MKDNVLVFMPAYNEEKVIGKVISDIMKEGFTDILVVDDKSKDNTALIAQESGATVLRHPINRGAGGASATGLEYAKRNGYEYLVFIDSDGQHDPKEIRKLLTHAKKHDVVIGSRLINKDKSMPIQRRLANHIGSILTAFFFGTYVKDSQSGFRVFNRKAIEKTIIRFDRFEFWSETFEAVTKHRLKVKEVPIRVIYSDHSLSKGQSIKNGFKMVTRFVFRS